MSTIYDWQKQGVTIIPNVLINNLNKLKINSDEFVLITYLLGQLSEVNQVDEIDQLSEHLSWHQSKIFDVLNSLMQKKYLSIELIPNKEGKQTDHYTLRPLFDYIDSNYFQQEKKVSKDTHSLENSIIKDFETEFGRTLSPIEFEKITHWIHSDHYEIDLIKIALREAVINQAYSLNYIDKILINWDKKNIRTAIQAEREISKFQKKINSKSNLQTSDFNIPIIDYSKGE